MDEHIFRFVVLGGIHAVVLTLMAIGFGITRYAFLRGDVEPQILVQERPAEVDVIEQHQRLVPVTLVFEGVCQGDGLFAVNRVDAAAQHHVLSKQCGFPHLGVGSQMIVIPVPIRICAQMLAGCRAHAAMHRVIYTFNVAGGTDALHTAGEKHATHDTAD